jgi:fumarate hydratase subunit beta
MPKKLTTPLTDDAIKSLKAGDEVLISGTIYTARDAAHKRLVLDIKHPPLILKDQIIYYCGPTPAMPGRPVGSAGPTTSGRMDGFTGPMLKAGIKGMIGKGPRSKETRELIKKHKAVYFVAAGGAGALLAQHIKSSQVVAYPDLGPEAIYKFEVVDFPVIVADDIKGRDIFEEGIKKFRRSKKQ